MLARFDRELQDFARGLRDEFRTSDGTRYRRYREPDGEVFERVSMDGARVRVPFTAEMRDLLLETARIHDPDELDDAVRRRLGFAPSDIIDPPRKN